MLSRETERRRPAVVGSSRKLELRRMRQKPPAGGASILSSAS
jgi:hypothetical protein